VHFCAYFCDEILYIRNRKRVNTHSWPPTYLLLSFTSMPELTDRCGASAAIEHPSNLGMEILAILNCDFC